MIIIISSSSLPFGSPITQVCKFNLKSEEALSGLSILGLLLSILIFPGAYLYKWTDIHARFLSIATPPFSPLHRIHAVESYHGFTPLWTDEHEQDEDVLFGLKHCNAGYSRLTALTTELCFPLVCFHLASFVAKSESTELVELVKRLWIFSFFLASLSIVDIHCLSLITRKVIPCMQPETKRE